MDLLKREHAPITDEAWEQIDDEARASSSCTSPGARSSTSPARTAGSSAASTPGASSIIEGTGDGVAHAVREVQPLVELRAPFKMQILELDYAARGADDLDLDPVIAVAERVARAEDTAIFHGFKEAHITGIIEASSAQAGRGRQRSSSGRGRSSPRKETLRAAGMNGPYALVLGLQAYDELDADSDDGYPLRRRIEKSIPDGRSSGPRVEGWRRPPLDARRRLRAHDRAGPVDRLRGARPHGTSSSISPSRSRSACSKRRPPCFSSARRLPRAEPTEARRHRGDLHARSLLRDGLTHAGGEVEEEKLERLLLLPRARSPCSSRARRPSEPRPRAGP